MGGLDRILRIVAGLVLIGLAVAGIGTPWTWVGVLALATGVINFYPAYAIYSISTCPVKKSV